jgi:tRNA U34 2-thiouridine synthase MnmA/TrmU
MESKNQPSKTSVPDYGTRDTRVLIGISGSMDSLVAAHLLKIQRHNLVAATVVNIWEDPSKEGPTSFSCHLSDEKLKGIQEFCHRLSIPHHVIRLGDEFMEKVVDVWVSDHLQGKSSRHCMRCQELRVSALFQKMKTLGASRLATGHYGKVFQTGPSGKYQVHSSHDHIHDQAGLLSSLPQELLSSLLLPLADLSQKEVMVLAENFGIQDLGSQKKTLECLTLTPELYPFLEKKVPDDLKERMGINLNSEKPMGLTLIERLSQTIRINNKFWVVNCQQSAGFKISEPVTGYLLMNGMGEIECWVYPKTISTFYVELGESLKLMPGVSVTVMKKKGKNSKVLFTGELRLLPIEEEGDQSVTKVDPTLDF